MRVGLGGVGIKAHMVIPWSWRTMGNDPSASEQYFKPQFLFLFLILKERISAFFLSLCSQKLIFLIPVTEVSKSHSSAFFPPMIPAHLFGRINLWISCVTVEPQYIFFSWMRKGISIIYLFVIIVCNHSFVFVNLALYCKYLTAL